MSKSSEKFLAMREQEQVRENAERDVPAYWEHLYQIAKKQPGNNAQQPPKGTTPKQDEQRKA